eukprot:TRINITY_DN15777_c0_g1_i1.p1 TRINITY_DN15777_c0_g1~~TRINITY_DN15777_c0_g1_i1.p1  ORF type:complete len:1387 (+),score=209.38 TRINITY_DN15777_c0_g1_i1:86-4246(+)
MLCLFVASFLVSSQLALGNKSLRLAYVGELSGPFASDETFLKGFIQCFIPEVNSRGGIPYNSDALKVEAYQCDTAGTDEQARRCVLAAAAGEDLQGNSIGDIHAIIAGTAVTNKAIIDASQEVQIPNIHLSGGNPVMWRAENTYAFGMHLPFPTYTRQALRVASLRNLKSISIVRSQAHGFSIISCVAALQWAMNAPLQVVGPSSQWCKKWMHRTKTCRLVSGHCRCGEQEEVDKLRDTLSLDYRIEDVPTFYEVDEAALGNGLVMNVVDENTTAYFEDIILDMLSQGSPPDVFLNFATEWHNVVHAMVRQKYSPQMMIGWQGGTTATWGESVDVSGQPILNVIHGEYAVGFGQWHPAMRFSDPLFGSNLQFTRSIKARFGEDIHYNTAGAVAGGVLLYIAMQKYMVSNFDLLNLEDQRAALREAIVDVNDETLWGTIRFNRFQQNNGRSTAAWQVLPNEDGVAEQMCVLPVSAAQTDLHVPFPSWDVRFGNSILSVLVLLPDSFRQQLGERARRAVEFALEWARQEMQLGDTVDSIVLHYKDSGCDSQTATKSFLTQLGELPPLLAVVGCFCSAATMPTAGLSGAISLPQLSIDAWATGLSDKNKYPSFFRLNPENCRVVAVYVKICVVFNWTKISFLSVDDAYGRDALQTFERIANSARPQVVRVVHQFTYSLLSDKTVDTSQVKQHLEYLARAPYRVLFVSPLSQDNLLTISRLAHDAGLGSGDWQWLITSMDSESGLTDKTGSMLWGSLWVQTAPREDPLHAADEQLDATYEVNIVDSMLALLVALSTRLPDLRGSRSTTHFGGDSQCSTDIPHITVQRSLLVKALQQVSFPGFGGQVEFNKHGDRATQTFTILNLARTPDGKNWTHRVVGKTAVKDSSQDASICSPMPEVSIQWADPTSKYKGVVFGGGAIEPLPDQISSPSEEIGLSSRDLILTSIGWSALFVVLLGFSAVCGVKFIRKSRHRRTQKIEMHQAKIAELQGEVRKLIASGTHPDLLMTDEAAQELVRKSGHGQTVDFIDAEEARQSKEGGISVAFLLESAFLELAEGDAGARKKNPNFHELADSTRRGAPFFDRESGLGCKEVCPRTKKLGCAFIDFYRAHRGICSHFLSWSWGYRVATLREALRPWAEKKLVNQRDSQARDIFLYCCFFCNNQYRIFEELGGQGSEDLEEMFQERLVHIRNAGGSVVALLDTWCHPCYLTRIWCIYEQWMACDMGLEIEITLPAEPAKELITKFMLGSQGIKEVCDSLTQINSAKAHATNPADEVKVKEMIANSHITFGQLDRQVAETFGKWIGSEVQTLFRHLIDSEFSHCVESSDASEKRGHRLVGRSLKKSRSMVPAGEMAQNAGEVDMVPNSSLHSVKRTAKEETHSEARPMVMSL